jgi:prolyl-tRNA synthetase
VDEKVAIITSNLKSLGITVKYDDADNNRPGWKFAEYEVKGVPVRLALGPRDMSNNVVEVARRDTKEKTLVSMDGIEVFIENLLEEIQQNLYQRALHFRTENTREANSWDEFLGLLKEKGGFISAHWDGTPETEQKIKELTKATIRCIPLDNTQEEGKCIISGNPSTQRVLFARAY